MTQGLSVIEQPDGYPPIHVWESDGKLWACCAYDHGPMCRLCQPVDETFAYLLQNCSEGYMVARADPEGEFRFKVTAQGAARAEDLIHNDPEHARLWAQLQQRGRG